MQPGELGMEREYTATTRTDFQAYTDVFHRLLPEVIEKYTDGDDYCLLHRCRDRKSETMKSVLPTGGITTTGGYGTKNTSFRRIRKKHRPFISDTVSNPSLNLKPSAIHFTGRLRHRIGDHVGSSTQWNRQPALSGNTWAGIIRYRRFRANAVHEPGIASPGLANSHGNTSAAYALLYGIRWLAAERLLAGSQLVDTDYYHNWKAAQYALREACNAGELAPRLTADSLKLWW